MKCDAETDSICWTDGAQGSHWDFKVHAMNLVACVVTFDNLYAGETETQLFLQVHGARGRRTANRYEAPAARTFQTRIFVSMRM